MKAVGTNGLLSSGSMYLGEWRKPVNISIGLHFIVLTLAMVAPSLFDYQPRLPEIYTVNLYTATEVAQPEVPKMEPPAPKAPETPTVRQIEPEPNKPVVSIQPSEPEVAPVAQTTIARPVSLKPLKLKVKVGKTPEEEALDKAKLSQVVQRLKASAAQREAREAADKAAKDAVNKLADAIKSDITAATGTTAQAKVRTDAAAESKGVSGPRGTGIEPDFYMKQYLSTVYQKIHDHWVLPDLQNWDSSLEAVLVIKIQRNGVIGHNFFERKSDNTMFNQLVLKAVRNASPLPPFPDQLRESALEIGLRFKPGELY